MNFRLRLPLLFLLVMLPAVVQAQDETAVSSSQALHPDGIVVRQEGSSWMYLLLNGEKHRVLNRFTLLQLGVTPTDIQEVDRETLKKIPSGSVFAMRPPKIKGAFDMHEHFRAGGDMAVYLKVAEKLGIEKTVFVPTGGSPDNRGYKEHTAALLEQERKWPDRVIAFCTIDEADQEAAKVFEECLAAGGRGLKLLGGHPDLYDAPLDSEIMKEVFRIANERDVPVLVHVSVVSLPKAKEEFQNLMDAFPHTRVQFAHYCSTIWQGINLDQCAEFLDRYPNMMIDLSMGGGIERYFRYMTEKTRDASGAEQLGIEKIKAFLLTYQDRILYGTDMILGGGSATKDPNWIRSRMMCDLSLLQEEWYRCPVVNKGKYARLPGFHFSEEVLRKILVENPKRFLKL